MPKVELTDVRKKVMLPRRPPNMGSGTIKERHKPCEPCKECGLVRSVLLLHLLEVLESGRKLEDIV